MKLVSAFLIGALFGLGIIVGGMGNPAKIMNFFDIAGTFDPSLIFVMGGALVTTFIGYRIVFAARKQPAFEGSFELPTKSKIDVPLISGAILFGIGWGITGFCPGGSIPAIMLGEPSVWIFVAAMLVGIMLAGAWLRRA
ncbi:MAG: DUF6691 family protein [Notoacmeibacter sp.]